jgi:thymidylate synthase
MRIYNDAFEMVREVERDLWEMSIRVPSHSMQDKIVENDRDYETVELQAYAYTLTNIDDEHIKKAVNYMKGNLEWATAELKDRFNPEYINPGESWKLHADLWEQFIRDGQFAYSYNERFREQLPLLIRELQIRPNSRQAVMTMYDRHQDLNNWGGKDRVPCSMHYQFLTRGGELHMVYVMRSCDFLNHFMHDVFFSTGLLKHVASKVGLKTGTFTHLMGSLHAYNKDMEARGIF